MSDVDPVEQLRALARLQDTPVEVPDDLREEVREVMPRRRARTRTRTLVAAAAAATLIVGSGVGIAALLLRQPERPEHGPACRGGPSLESPLYALGPGADPITDCAELWRTGFYPVGGEGNGSVPPLVACVGPNGAVEVFPGPLDFCDALGLETAAINLDPEAAAVSEFAERITEEINLADCASTDEVKSKIERLMEDLDLEGWAVAPNEDATHASCAKAQVDSSLKVVHIFRY